MPKLVILNGPLGSGKSTLAKEYAKLHPMTLVLDIDRIWFMMSAWRDNWETSLPLAKEMGLEMARIHLKAGYDVIAPIVILDEKLISDLMQMSEELGADFNEALIDIDQEEAIKRYFARKGSPEGYEAGKESEEEKRQKFIERYDRMNRLAGMRKNVLKLKNTYGDIEGDCKKLDSLLKD